MGPHLWGFSSRPCTLWTVWVPMWTLGNRCPRLATSEAPDAMEEWDVPQMKKEVESLKYQLAFKREMSSKTIPELLKWIEDGIPKDPFLNPDLMKNNPWVEKGKCAIL
ncbi:guanine nucleotide-binding protein [Lynx pardinus]|uniref:Guanine nucleotide-binding protein G(I)/G(S)/G(O) subunit gamma-13 n=1 Tax=Lynx pardinus TaxID=191816 RepID=A0A485PT56_LYNPA|nr:guanine nucleotide-binding protein [Lynx pardinus]